MRGTTPWLARCPFFLPRPLELIGKEARLSSSAMDDHIPSKILRTPLMPERSPYGGADSHAGGHVCGGAAFGNGLAAAAPQELELHSPASAWLMSRSARLSHGRPAMPGRKEMIKVTAPWTEKEHYDV